MTSDDLDRVRPGNQEADAGQEPETAIPANSVPSELINLLNQDVPYALVVDDDAIIRMVASEILEDAGFLVLAAADGDTAFDLLKTRYADVVLLFTDVQMPGKLDGFALAHNVTSAWPHISIVVTSGHARPGPGSLPNKARFIGKPFSAELVHSHLQEIFPTARSRSGSNQSDFAL